MRVTEFQPEIVNGRKVIGQAESFLLECLSPFEISHRGGREANAALRRLDEVREEEMRRLARELHDEASQMLVAAHLTLREVGDQLGPYARRSLERVHDQLREVEAQLRRIAHEMRPSMLDDLGLAAALVFLARGIEARHGLVVRVEGAIRERLAHDIELALYRAAQEAIHNAVRHANAKTVRVRLQRFDDRFQLTVTDDGCGFEPRVRTGGLGLRGIAERLEPLQGTLHILSAPGSGTELHIEVPRTEERHAAHLAGR